MCKPLFLKHIISSCIHLHTHNANSTFQSHYSLLHYSESELSNLVIKEPILSIITRAFLHIVVCAAYAALSSFLLSRRLFLSTLWGLVCLTSTFISFSLLLGACGVLFAGLCISKPLVPSPSSSLGPLSFRRRCYCLHWLQLLLVFVLFAALESVLWHIAYLYYLLLTAWMRTGLAC